VTRLAKLQKKKITIRNKTGVREKISNIKTHYNHQLIIIKIIKCLLQRETYYTTHFVRKVIKEICITFCSFNKLFVIFLLILLV